MSALLKYVCGGRWGAGRCRPAVGLHAHTCSEHMFIKSPNPQELLVFVWCKQFPSPHYVTLPKRTHIYLSPAVCRACRDEKDVALYGVAGNLKTTQADRLQPQTSIHVQRTIYNMELISSLIRFNRPWYRFVSFWKYWTGLSAKKFLQKSIDSKAGHVITNLCI